MTLHSFIAESVKNIDSRFFEPHAIHTDKNQCAYYEEFTVQITARALEDGSFEIHGVDPVHEIEVEGKTFQEMIEDFAGCAEEVSHDEIEGDDEVDFDTIEYGWDALEIDESQWEKGVIGTMTIRVAIDYKYYEIIGDRYGKQYRSEEHANPFYL